MTPRLIEVRQKVLNKNDIAARALRERFRQAGVCVISLASSPGSGKTAFLERVLTLMRADYRVAALVGDLATDNDAVRLARSKAPVKQICTGTICHLDAGMVERALDEWNLDELDFLFIENVGNLVCPSSYDLGENARAVLLSVTEGEDKPLKYPTIFHERRRGQHHYEDGSRGSGGVFIRDCSAEHSARTLLGYRCSKFRQREARALTN